jgi:hypothetical protein
MEVIPFKSLRKRKAGCEPCIEQMVQDTVRVVNLTLARAVQQSNCDGEVERHC